MNESRTGWLACLIVEEQVEFTLLELCRVSGASEVQLVRAAQATPICTMRFGRAALRYFRLLSSARASVSIDSHATSSRSKKVSSLMMGSLLGDAPFGTIRTLATQPSAI